jgi:hypothetical protein
MKQLLASAACLAFIACGSSGSSGANVPTADQVGTVEPETSLVQLIGPEQLHWQEGQIEMKYALRIRNVATDAITLRQIQIQTVGVEGPYYVPQSSYFFREPVIAGAARDVEFFAKAYSGGDRYRIDAQSPVSIRIIAYFEAPGGNFRQTFITNLGQSFKDY